MVIRSLACKFLILVTVCMLNAIALRAVAVDTLGANLLRIDGSHPGSTANVSLNAAGQFVWVVTLTADAAGPTEIDALFTFSGRPLVDATANTTDYDFLNASELSDLPTWVELTDFDPGPDVDNRAVGFQVSPTNNQVLAALSSVDFSVAGDHIVFTALTQGPARYIHTGLTTTLSWRGTIAKGGVLTPIAGSFSYTALWGDANLDRRVDLEDFNIVLFNLGTGTTWSRGNFDGLATVDLNDFKVPLIQLGATAPPAAFSLARSVPEPSSIAIMMLLMAIGLAWMRLSSRSSAIIKITAS